VQPSSLVFVAIIVGWAAYLLPQWVRRREALSQSRGHDRHSSGLRVLSRRPRTASGPSTTPLLPDPLALPAPVVDPLADPLEGRPAPDRPAPDRPAPGFAPRSVAARVPSAAAEAARRRARVLSLLLIGTATAWALCLVAPGLDALAWTVTALLGLDLLALVATGRRRAVRGRVRELERRHRADLARREVARRRPSPPAVPSSAVAAAADTRPAGPATAPVPPVERASERVARELDEGAAAAVWTPVPVPPPTYTLKETAPWPEPAPLDLPSPPPPVPTDPAAATAASAPAAQDRPKRPWDEDRSFADDLDLDAVLARRRAVNG
jgi:hypothetical protein